MRERIKFIELSDSLDRHGNKINHQTYWETYEVVYKSEETNWQRKSVLFRGKGKAQHKNIERFFKRKYPDRVILQVIYH